MKCQTYFFFKNSVNISAIKEFLYFQEELMIELSSFSCQITNILEHLVDWDDWKSEINSKSTQKMRLQLLYL